MAPLSVLLCSSRRNKISRISFNMDGEIQAAALACMGMKRSIATRGVRRCGTGEHLGIHLDMANDTSLHKAFHFVMSLTGTAMNQRESRVGLQLLIRQFASGYLPSLIKT